MGEGGGKGKGTGMNISALIDNFSPQGSPFGTHVNLLCALGPGIKTVLELGAGAFSTSLFLDRDYYPDLIELTTIEQDREWVLAGADPRHKVVIEPEPIEPFLEGVLDLDSFDLIFVDNSTFGERRCDTLRWLAKHVGRSLVVAHDFNVLSYAEAAGGFDCKIIDDRQVPWTALLWRTR
jgi:hypothetical protein